MSSDGTTAWADDPSVDVDVFNDGLDPAEPTVDVMIHHPDNLDDGHASKVNQDLLLKGFATAQEVFGVAGVQLRLVAYRTGTLAPRLFSIRASEPDTQVPNGPWTNMYVHAARRPSVVSDEAIEAFTSIIGDLPNSDRTVHVVVLQGMFITHWEPVVAGRVYEPQLIETSGLSFPGYMHGDTMPRSCRGVVTITNLRKNEDSWKTIAHELGHKLLNVSHESGAVDPAHEIQSDDGLMLYGKGTQIPSGPDGRFHRERLHRSPFIHRIGEDGERVHNPDYQDGGFYHDPIYDGVCVDF